MPKNYDKLTWGKDYRKIPRNLRATLGELENTDFVVACSKTLTPDDFNRGRYTHLTIESPADVSENWTELLPSPNIGRAGFLNSTIVEVPNLEAGKVWQTFEGRAPHGRYGTGSHITHYRRLVWARKFVMPPMRKLAFRRIERATNPERIAVRFQICEVLNHRMPDFEPTLMSCLNLLQHNVGKVGLFPVESRDSEYLLATSENLGWIPLPTGSVGDRVRDALRRKSASSVDNLEHVADRLRVLQELKPRRLLESSKGWTGYFLAEFTDTLAVLENLLPDHALFILRGNWSELSKLGRSELDQIIGSDACERIIHRGNWEDRLSAIVHDARGEVL